MPELPAHFLLFWLQLETNSSFISYSYFNPYSNSYFNPYSYSYSYSNPYSYSYSSLNSSSSTSLFSSSSSSSNPIQSNKTVSVQLTCSFDSVVSVVSCEKQSVVVFRVHVTQTDVVLTCRYFVEVELYDAGSMRCMSPKRASHFHQFFI